MPALGSAGAASSILFVLATASREKPAVVTSRAGHHGLSLQSTCQQLKTAMWRSGRDLGPRAFRQIRVHSRVHISPQGKCDSTETVFRHFPLQPIFFSLKPQQSSSNFCLPNCLILTTNWSNAIMAKHHLINTKKNNIKQNKEHLF